MDLKDLPARFPRARLHLLVIHDDHWRLHGRARNRSIWTARGFSDDYRLMGQWRLLYPFAFSRLIGHRYMLFMDVDSRVLEPIGENMVDMMKNSNLNLAYRKLVQDPSIGRGLAELTRYYLSSRIVTPTQLFEDCVPQNIDGLHSPSGDRGWKTTVIYGNFVILSLEFWYRTEVQDFLELCISTGDHVVHRWNEQQVMAMIRLLFITNVEEKLLTFKYEHLG